MRKVQVSKAERKNEIDAVSLLTDLCSLIHTARQRVATTANATQTMLFWHVGRRILKETLSYDRAAYGKQILATVSRELTSEFGRGFSYASVNRMVQFVQQFPDEVIVSTLSAQLSWSHFIELLPIKDSLTRGFYAEVCRIERWDVRHGRMSPDTVFRDPYILDFLGLKDTYSERDLETAILREIERFLIELGSGFTFVARQKRISVGKNDFHLDLLFYHRHLRRLIAIELKLESFQPAHVGQLEFYLRWLDKHERLPSEESPMGLILCASADAEQVELFHLEDKSIRVSEYHIELPPLAILEKRLHQAIAQVGTMKDYRRRGRIKV